MNKTRLFIAGGWLLAAGVAVFDHRRRQGTVAGRVCRSWQVIQHPRCLNCHPRGDRPLQGDRMQLHQPLAVRGKDGFGATAMRCTSCHGAQNFDAKQIASVPGNRNWHLAPIEMAWHGRTLGAICHQLKDRSRNGGKTMPQMIEHMAHDELVGRAWAPGTGRAPAPGTQKALGDLIKAWADSGAHCRA